MAISDSVLKKPLRLVIIGPSGGGKGTQAKLIAKEFGLKHFSTGDLLRKEVAKKTPLGIKIANLVAEGKWVPDEVVFQVLVPHLKKAKKQGFILDGSPRTLQQAKMLEELLQKENCSLDKVILLKVSPEEIIRRWKAKVAQGERFQPGRDDDRLDILKNRLQAYQETIGPIVDFYQRRGKLMVVDGERSIEEIFNDLKNRLLELANG